MAISSASTLAGPLRLCIAGCVVALLVLTAPAPASAAISFGAGHTIGTCTTWFDSMTSADLDVDGDADVVGGGQAGAVTAWENDGSPFSGSWSAHPVGTSADRVTAVAVQDMDGDGDPDVVSGSGQAEDYEIIIWENDGTPMDGGWIQHDVGAVVGANARIALADMDVDSFFDIVSIGEAYGPWGEVAVWRNDHTPFDAPWNKTVVDTAGTLGGVTVADFDNDGWTDIAYARNEYYDYVARNDHTPFDGGWSIAYVGAHGSGMGTVNAADLDGDGYMDLVTACGYLPYNYERVFRNDHTPFDGAWAANVYGLTSGHWAAVADFDLDSRTDILTGSHTNEDHEVIVWGNNGSPFSGYWPQHDIGAQGFSPADVDAADLDGDGDADALWAAGGPVAAPYPIVAYENLAITNGPPGIAADAATVDVDEGDLATNAGIMWDPDGDTLALSATLGAVTGLGGGMWSWQYQTTDGPPESQTVTVTASDGQYAAECSFQLGVANVAPVVGAVTVPLAPVPVGSTVVAGAPFTDAGTGDTHTCIWDWGHGSSAGTVTETNGSGTTGGGHVYSIPGVYSVSATVTDDDGAPGSSTAAQYVVVYDPSAGFATGGGWIWSPEGAYWPVGASEPSPLVGKATFGFVSKYLKGASAPTGNTQFQFHAGGIDFKSTSYEWLVIAGAKAMYKGVGTVDGAGDYGFMLTAWDGQVAGGTDRFRMRIWDNEAAGWVVYDNQRGAGDTVEPSTALGGGSIVVHKR